MFDLLVATACRSLSMWMDKSDLWVWSVFVYMCRRDSCGQVDDKLLSKMEHVTCRQNYHATKCYTWTDLLEGR